ncbi:ABC transporter ATP-binding protein [Romeria aff. gracilis LEGE 07310]|uniref:Spermidine/putrescine import ATP-binding protein PotA n=1 Tax=Vasconcelosia minhoensis LEGE 07310 TaxID=915328 RepID=A0A8J7DCW8_9CYAN|nr:ABC transporter ATP-binding protein [Romeria gracilis]MBE9079312.1 ABC transporter ATP-binding protein [Romeria aff. gracilis LEGE 07310]
MPQAVSTKSSGSAQSEAAIDVELRQIVKVFDGEPAITGIDLTVQKGEFFSILGPSGCGKTTALRLIAGFETPTAGEVFIQGRAMGRVVPHRRPVNTVFQNYALFDHMSVWDNIAFGLKIQNCSRAELRSRVGEALQLVKMESFSKRYPAQLSGGQKQRVALARALVKRPAVMLLDEPLGALDLKLRKQMQVELSNLHRRLGITFIMVTHDQEEALSLSDRIAVMRAGQIEQVGRPDDIYEYPATAFVANFIGETNLLRGQIEPLDFPLMRVTTESGLDIRVRHRQVDSAPPPQTPVELSIRPEKVHLSGQPADADNCVEGRVQHTMYLGTHIHCMVELVTGDRFTVLQPSHTQHLPDPQKPVYAYWSAADCLALTA